jgi:hypothetical protein
VKDSTYLSTVLTNRNELRPEIGKKELQMPIEHIMQFFLYRRVNQYSEQKK